MVRAPPRTDPSYPPQHSHHWTEAGAHILRLTDLVRKRRAACPQATGRGLERLITCAPEARRARADLNPRVEKVRPFVSWFRYPGRPRGGLTNRPVSSLSQQCRPLPFGKRTLQEPYGSRSKRIPFCPGCHSVEKRNFVRPLTRVPLPRTLPVVHTAPWPHALWSILCVAIWVFDPSGNTFR